MTMKYQCTNHQLFQVLNHLDIVVHDLQNDETASVILTKHVISLNN